MNFSGFSFVHNAIAGGYPIIEAVRSVAPFVDEMVVVDAQSDDGTREVLEKLGCRIIDAHWGYQDEGTLTSLHALNTQCHNDMVIHFEADEIFDPRLLEKMVTVCDINNVKNLGCWRVQVEQNFQRIREYPVKVHRIFEKGTATKDGRTTKQHDRATYMMPEHGYLWDITNCFRHSWLQRIKQNAELWHEEIMYRRAPKHAFENHIENDVEAFLNEPHWLWERTPIDIPEILKPLVGKTFYEMRI